MTEVSEVSICNNALTLLGDETSLEHRDVT
jgi:hypothetical protein